MPQGQEVMSFLGGLGSSIAGSLREKQLLDRKRREDEEDWLDEALLKAIQHPSTTIEDYNKAMTNIFERRGKAAGVKPEELQGVLQHILRQVGTVTEQKPGTEPPDYEGMTQQQLEQQTRQRRATETRPKTLGDIETETAARKTKAIAEASLPSKKALEQQKALTRSAYRDQITEGHLREIQARGDTKAQQTYQSRYLLNKKQGMSDKDAQAEAVDYAKSLSDVAMQSKLAGIELNKARVELIQRRTKDIDQDNVRQDKALGIRVKELDDRIKRTGIMQDRLALSGIQQELISLRQRRNEAAAAMRQAAAIAANILADPREREGQNIEWEKRKNEIQEIDQNIARLNAALPSETTTTTPTAPTTPSGEGKKGLKKAAATTGGRPDLLAIPIRNKRTGQTVNVGEKLPDGRTYLGTDPKTNQPVFR